MERMLSNQRRFDTWIEIQTENTRALNLLRLEAAQRPGTTTTVLLRRAVQRLRQANRLIDRAMDAVIAEEVE